MDAERQRLQEADREGAPWRLCDVEDQAAVVRLFEEARPAVVFHLASAVRGTRDLGAVVPMFHANLGSAVYVMAAACQTGCRKVVLAASMEELPLDQPARFPYAVAKRAASEGVSRRDFFTKVADALDSDVTRERFMREAGFVEA